MRIWHEQLIPKLCRQHLLACWREALGAYSIIVNNKKCSYSNHPATKEFTDNPFKLWKRLRIIRAEMLKRGYNPKPLPEMATPSNKEIQEWQTLEEQIKHLKSKGCECKI